MRSKLVFELIGMAVLALAGMALFDGVVTRLSATRLDKEDAPPLLNEPITARALKPNHMPLAEARKRASGKEQIGHPSRSTEATDSHVVGCA